MFLSALPCYCCYRNQMLTPIHAEWVKAATWNQRLHWCVKCPCLAFSIALFLCKTAATWPSCQMSACPQLLTYQIHGNETTEFGWLAFTVTHIATVAPPASRCSSGDATDMMSSLWQSAALPDQAAGRF